MTSIIVWYLDTYGGISQHKIETKMPGLIYQDLSSYPVEVKRILRDGLTIGRLHDGKPTRSGIHIPASRIVQIDFGDDYHEL